MLVSKLICHFYSHSSAFGFLTFTLQDNIVVNAASKKTNQSFRDFQTGISAATYASLGIEQLISKMRTTIMDTIASMQDSEREVIPSFRSAWLAKIHDILHKTVSLN